MRGVRRRGQSETKAAFEQRTRTAIIEGFQVLQQGPAAEEVDRFVGWFCAAVSRGGDASVADKLSSAVVCEVRLCFFRRGAAVVRVRGEGIVAAAGDPALLLGGKLQAWDVNLTLCQECAGGTATVGLFLGALVLWDEVSWLFYFGDRDGFNFLCHSNVFQQCEQAKPHEGRRERGVRTSRPSAGESCKGHHSA